MGVVPFFVLLQGSRKSSKLPTDVRFKIYECIFDPLERFFEHLGAFRCTKLALIRHKEGLKSRIFVVLHFFEHLGAFGCISAHTKMICCDR
jgi:hypothetical protein